MRNREISLSSKDVDLIARAAKFAKEKHEGVFRKNSKEPYFTHPERVANLVRSFGGDAAQIAAAYLHDVPEDTDVEISEIKNKFGRDVAHLVIWMTNRCDHLHGNRRLRKKLERGFIKHAPDRVKTIKVCDVLDNTADLESHDPDFRDLYLSEKRELFKESLKGADSEALELLRIRLFGE